MSKRGNKFIWTIYFKYSWTSTWQKILLNWNFEKLYKLTYINESEITKKMVLLLESAQKTIWKSDGVTINYYSCNRSFGFGTFINFKINIFHYCQQWSIPYLSYEVGPLFRLCYWKIILKDCYQNISVRFQVVCFCAVISCS